MHLREIRVENWNRLSGLRITDLQQINLITGINGTGKSALLGALTTLAEWGTLTIPDGGPPRLAYETSVKLEADLAYDEQRADRPIPKPHRIEPTDWKRRADVLARQCETPGGHEAALQSIEIVDRISGPVEAARTGDGRIRDPRQWATNAGSGQLAMAETLTACSLAAGGVVTVDVIDGNVHASAFDEWWTALVDATRAGGAQLFWATHRQETVHAAVSAANKAAASCAVHLLWQHESSKAACTSYRGETLNAAIEVGLSLT